MLHRIGVACGLALAVLFPHTQPVAAQTSSLLREISTVSFGVITLGEVFTQAGLVGRAQSESVHFLPAGLVGTEEVVVSLSRDGRVRGLLSRYPETHDVDEALASYMGTLGSPAVPELADGQRCVYWADEAARFEIHIGSGNGGRVMMSIRLDLTLVPNLSPCALRDYAARGLFG